MGAKCCASERDRRPSVAIDGFLTAETHERGMETNAKLEVLRAKGAEYTGSDTQAQSATGSHSLAKAVVASTVQAESDQTNEQTALPDFILAQQNSGECTADSTAAKGAGEAAAPKIAKDAAADTLAIEERLKILFKTIDANGDGRISRSELKSKLASNDDVGLLLGVQGANKRDDQLKFRVQEICKLLDESEDDTIGEKEFVAIGAQSNARSSRGKWSSMAWQEV